MMFQFNEGGKCKNTKSNEHGNICCSCLCVLWGMIESISHTGDHSQQQLYPWKNIRLKNMGLEIQNLKIISITFSSYYGIILVGGTNHSNILLAFVFFPICFIFYRVWGWEGDERTLLDSYMWTTTVAWSNHVECSWTFPPVYAVGTQ